MSGVRKVELACVSVILLTSSLFKFGILDTLEQARLGAEHLSFLRRLPFFIPLAFCGALGAFIGIRFTGENERSNITPIAKWSELPAPYLMCAGIGVLVGVAAGGIVASWFNGELEALGYAK